MRCSRNRILFLLYKFQKLALLPIFCGSKYSLGIDSDLFKYFTASSAVRAVVMSLVVDSVSLFASPLAL